MPKTKNVKDKEDIQEDVQEGNEKGEGVLTQEPSEKEELTQLYALMKKYAVNSIGDVEVKLSRL